MYPQRRIGPGFVFVLVLLAGLAGGGSYYLTRQTLLEQEAGANGSQPARAQPQLTPRASENPRDPATFCPTVTEKAVTAAGLAGDLVLLRYVEGTATGVSGAQAWVCKNADDVLIYQGHRKSGQFTAANGNDTILLARGIRGKVDTEGDDGFVATNPQDPANLDDPSHTEYHLSATTFYFETTPSAARTEYKITRTVP